MWEKVVGKLRTGAMPPAGMPRPDAATHDALIVVSRRRARSRGGGASESRPALPHRLNRAEYANAIRDLLALDVDAARCCRRTTRRTASTTTPTLLGVSPALLERYLSAAAKISALAVGEPGHRRRARRRIASAATRRRPDRTTRCRPGTRGGLMAHAHVPARRRVRDQGQAAARSTSARSAASSTSTSSRSRSTASASCSRRSADPTTTRSRRSTRRTSSTRSPSGCRCASRCSAGQRAGRRRVPAEGRRRRAAIAAAAVPAQHADRHRSPRPAARREHDGHADRSTPTGAGDTPSRQRVFACTPGDPREPAPERERAKTACATKIVSHAGAPRVPAAGDRRGSRGPDGVLRRRARETGASSAASSWRCAACSSARSSSSASSAIRRASPPGAPYRISDLELASRLSFFLWSSIPDDELLDAASRAAAAQARRARAPGAAHARRSARAARWSTNFAGQWLHVRNLRSTTPDKNDFPGLRRQPAAGVRARARAVRRQHHRARIAASSTC